MEGDAVGDTPAVDEDNDVDAQVALVVDPRLRELAFFHWRGDEVRDCGFVTVTD